MAGAHHDHEVKSFAHGTRLLVKIIEYSLPVILGGLELSELIHGHDIQHLPQALNEAITNQDLSTLLWKAALVLYFLSWVIGGESDTEMQADVYLTAPHGGRLNFRDIGAIVVLAAVFGILCWAREHYQWFAIALSVFWNLNFVFWRYMVGVLKGSVQNSYMGYGRAGRYIDMEKVRVVEGYIDGKWQWWRFAIGAVLIVVMDALAFFVNLPPGYAHGAIFFFVVFVEGWIWLMRWRAKVSLKTLDDLSERYGSKLASA